MAGPLKVRSDWEARIWIEGAGDAERRLEVTPAIAGWDALSMRSYTFRASQTIDGESATDEMAMVLLAGSLTLEVAGPGGHETWECDGRTSVFDGAPYVIYLPPGHTYQMTVHADADCAYGRAPAAGRRRPRLIRPEEVQSWDDNSAVRTRELLTTTVTERLRCAETIIAASGWGSLSAPDANPALTREQVSYFRTRPESEAGGQWLPAGASAGNQGLTLEHGDALIIRGAPGKAVSPPEFELYCLTFAVDAESASTTSYA